jgi:Glycine/D-amino acid oxidases (deaminating)
MAPVSWALPCPRLILSAANLSRPFVEGSIETGKRVGVQGLEKLTPDQIRARFSVVTGKLDGWNINVWNPTAGWAAAGTAIERMAGRCSAEGGGNTFRGRRRGMCSECKGVVTADGTRHEADVVILAAGAWTPSLLDVKGQLTAKGHNVAHIQLTPSETKYYASMPIMDNLELGYFFPPQENGIFKMAFLSRLKPRCVGTCGVCCLSVQTDPSAIHGFAGMLIQLIGISLSPLILPIKDFSWQPVDRHMDLNSFLLLENISQICLRGLLTQKSCVNGNGGLDKRAPPIT